MKQRITAAEFQQRHGTGIGNQVVNAAQINETKTRTQVQNSKPERDKTPALGRTVQGEEKSDGRTIVRFTGYRVRPLDPDNFAGSIKDCLDGLRHAQIILGDEPWRIILETEQVKVRSYKEEKTVIEVDIPSVS